MDTKYFPVFYVSQMWKLAKGQQRWDTWDIFQTVQTKSNTQFKKSVETQGLDRFKLPWITRPWIKQRRCLTYQEVAAVKTVFLFVFFWIEHPPQSWQTA